MATGAGPYYSAMTNHNVFPLFVNGLVQSRDFAGIAILTNSHSPRDLFTAARSLAVPLIWSSWLMTRVTAPPASSAAPLLLNDLSAGAQRGAAACPNELSHVRAAVNVYRSRDRAPNDYCSHRHGSSADCGSGVSWSWMIYRHACASGCHIPEKALRDWGFASGPYVNGDAVCRIASASFWWWQHDDISAESASRHAAHLM